MSKKKRFIPWFTLVIILICLVMFGIFAYYTLSEINGVETHLYSQLGAPSALEVYQGKYWGVLWNSFLHNRVDLLFVNLFFLYLFGCHIEKHSGILTLAFLGLIASSFTSMTQLALSNDPGIGMTGVNCFFATYIYGRSIMNRAYRMYQHNATTIVSLLILCGIFIARFAFGLNIGVASILSGVTIGFIAGVVAEWKKKVSPVLLTFFTAGLSYTLFYAPWSLQWNMYKAYEYHELGLLKQAKIHYTKADDIYKNQTGAPSPYSPAAKNMKLIRIDELSDEAYELHNNRQFLEAKIVYDQILELDPDHPWTQQQIKKLP